MIEIYLISIVAGFLLGYLTNWLAIVSLFHPRKKFFGFQGLVPRYKKEIGERIGENAHVIFPDSLKKVFQIPLVGDKIKDFFKDSVANEIVKMSDDELERIIKKVGGPRRGRSRSCRAGRPAPDGRRLLPACPPTTRPG